MTVKRRNQKNKYKKDLINKSVKIRCYHCNINKECIYRASKEKSESLGITTYCSITPNRPKSFNKRRNRRK